MKGLLFYRNSFEHIAEVRQVDTKYNAEVENAAKRFKAAHTGVEIENSPEWFAILTEIEERRMEEHRSTKARVIDYPRGS